MNPAFSNWFPQFQLSSVPVKSPQARSTQVRFLIAFSNLKLSIHKISPYISLLLQIPCPNGLTSPSSYTRTYTHTHTHTISIAYSSHILTVCGRFKENLHTPGSRKEILNPPCLLIHLIKPETERWNLGLTPGPLDSWNVTLVTFHFPEAIQHNFVLRFSIHSLA